MVIHHLCYSSVRNSECIVFLFLSRFVQIPLWHQHWDSWSSLPIDMWRCCLNHSLCFLSTWRWRCRLSREGKAESSMSYGRLTYEHVLTDALHIFILIPFNKDNYKRSFKWNKKSPWTLFVNDQTISCLKEHNIRYLPSQLNFQARKRESGSEEENKRFDFRQSIDGRFVMTRRICSRDAPISKVTLYFPAVSARKKGIQIWYL